MCDWKNILMTLDDSLEYAIKVLHKGGCRIALVVDESKKLLGTITDGDIRRALLKNFTMDAKVSLIMNSNPIKADKSNSRKELLSMMSSRGLIHMPIVDENEKLCRLETMQHLIEDPTYNNPVFIMAGGFGTRLHPLTKETPKPLLKVGDVPILETILSQFISTGFSNFYISVHYKAEMIQDYFKDGSDWGVSIKYIYEKDPLGTAGCIGLVCKDLPDLPIIVINGDILTKVDFEQLLAFHVDNGGDATMCVREYDFQVPYGVISTNKKYITSIVEKPAYKFFVNAGIYVLNPSILDMIKEDGYLDMTRMLELKIEDNGKVVMFPVHEYWMDIGRLDQFEQAQQDSKAFFI